MCNIWYSLIQTGCGGVCTYYFTLYLHALNTFVLLLCMYVTPVVVVCFSLILFVAGPGNQCKHTCRSTEVPAPHIMLKTKPKVDDFVVVRLQACR